MTIQYHDQDEQTHSKFDPRYRTYTRCPIDGCGKRIRSNWRLTRHLARRHGIEAKRY
jgi:hypothetical protein